jgi:hypothetical protein
MDLLMGIPKEVEALCRAFATVSPRKTGRSSRGVVPSGREKRLLDV